MAGLRAEDVEGEEKRLVSTTSGAAVVRWRNLWGSSGPTINEKLVSHALDLATSLC
jgi:hypothetical protein